MRPDQQLRGFLDRSSITSELRSRGFSRSGQTWTRTSGGVAHVIDFQRSRFSDPGTVKFTINMGVALDAIWRLYSGDGLGGAIHEADCFPRFRVGEVLGGFRREATDIWWTIAENNGSDEVAAEVKSAVLERCLPILDRLDSADAVFRFVQDEAPPRHANAPFTRIILAIVHHLHGDIRKATSLLEELESHSSLGVEWRNRIRDVRTRLGQVHISGE
jgi:hypothetical protein